MLVPELERPVGELQDMGIPVRFHPKFEWPEARSKEVRRHEAVGLADFCGRPHFMCDLTGEQLSPADAAVLTPWELRNAKSLTALRESTDVFRVFQLVTDWSDWIVKGELLTEEHP
jgi:hypothetical protein